MIFFHSFFLSYHSIHFFFSLCLCLSLTHSGGVVVIGIGEEKGGGVRDGGIVEVLVGGDSNVRRSRRCEGVHKKLPPTGR